MADVGGDYDNRDLQLRGRQMLPRLKDDDRAGRRSSACKIVAGSDTGYGPTSVGRVSSEVANLVEAGLTPLQALQAATSSTRKCCDSRSRSASSRPASKPTSSSSSAIRSRTSATLLDPLLVISNGRIGLDRLNFARLVR